MNTNEMNKKDYSAIIKSFKEEIHSLGYLCSRAKKVYTKEVVTDVMKASGVKDPSKKFVGDLLNVMKSNKLAQIVLDYLPHTTSEGSVIALRKVQMMKKDGEMKDFTKFQRLYVVDGGVISIKPKTGFSVEEIAVNVSTQEGFTLPVTLKKDKSTGEEVLSAWVIKSRFSEEDVITAAVRFVQNGSEFKRYDRP